MPENARRRRRLPLWAVLLIVLGALPVAYLVLVNVLLNVGLVPKLTNVEPEKFSLHYRRAWTLMPGHAWVRGFGIRAQEPDIQWKLELDRAEVQIDVKALFHQTFRTKWVKADGLTFKMRPRTVGAPPLEGFDSGPPPPRKPLKVALSKLWTAELQNVDVGHVREIWMSGWAYEGHAHANGSFYLKPLQEVEVSPDTLELGAGQLTYLGKPVVNDFDGVIQMALDRMHPLENKGLTALKFITAKVSLRGNVTDLHILNEADPSLPAQISGGAGPFALTLGLVHGELTSDSKLDLAARDIRVDALGYSAQGRMTVEAIIPDSAKKTEGHVSLSVEPLQLSRQGAHEPLVVGRGLRAVLRIPNPNLTRTLEGMSASIQLLPSSTAGVSRLTKTLAPGAKSKAQSSRGRVSAKIELSPGFAFATGALAFTLPGISVPLGGNATAEGDLSVDANFTHVPLNEDKDLTQSKVQASVTVKEMRLGLGKYQLRGTLHATAKRVPGETTDQLSLDVSPVSIWHEGVPKALVQGPGLRGITSWPMRSTPNEEVLRKAVLTIELARADVPDLTALNTYIPKSLGLAFLSGRGTAHAWFKLNADGRAGDARIDISAEQARALYSGVRLRTNLAARVVLSKLDLDRQRISLDTSTVELRDVNIDGAAAEKTVAWSGRVEIKKGELEFKPLTISGNVRGELQDARPILAVFAAKTNLPKWLLPLLRLNGLTVDGKVLIRETLVDVPTFEVSGGGFKAHGRIQMENDKKNGAMVVSAGPIVVGLALENDKPVLQVGDPDGWYRKLLMKPIARTSPPPH